MDVTAMFAPTFSHLNGPPGSSTEQGTDLLTDVSAFLMQSARNTVILTLLWWVSRVLWSGLGLASPARTRESLASRVPINSSTTNQWFVRKWMLMFFTSFHIDFWHSLINKLLQRGSWGRGNIVHWVWQATIRWNKCAMVILVLTSNQITENWKWLCGGGGIGRANVQWTGKVPYCAFSHFLTTTGLITKLFL